MTNKEVAEVVYLKMLFADENTQLSCDAAGILSLLVRGQIRKIGRVVIEDGVMIYSQPESYKHLLKAWNAWTIDKVIFDSLPDNSIIRHILPDVTFQYTKKYIQMMKEKTKHGQLSISDKRYEERYFTGHGLRIILPIAWAAQTHTNNSSLIKKFFI